MAKRQYVNARELIGGTIQSVITASSGAAQVLIIEVPVRKRGGKIVHKIFHCEIWRDEEGNGPGFFYVEDLDGESKR